MARRVAFLVVAVLTGIVLPATASDVLRCTSKRQSDGQIYFNMTYDLKGGVNDCETQWVLNGSVAGIAYADGHMECIPPLLKATANTAVLQTCHVQLECLLICPSAGINKKELCSCDTTSPTTLPEVGLPDRSVAVWIGVSLFGILLVSLIAIILRKKKKCSGYALSGPGPAEEEV